MLKTYFILTIFRLNHLKRIVCKNLSSNTNVVFEKKIVYMTASNNLEYYTVHTHCDIPESAPFVDVFCVEFLI